MSTYLRERRVRARSHLCAVIGLLALGAAPAIAGARDGDTASAVPVSRSLLAPVNLKQARQSLAVLANAALEACGASSFSIPDHRNAVLGSSCWRTSMTDAVSKANNPYITAAFQQQPLVTVAMRNVATGDVATDAVQR